jgi:hypothetical protein
MDNLWIEGAAVYSSNYLDKYVIEKVTPKGGIRIKGSSNRLFKVHNGGISAYHIFSGDWYGATIFADTIEAREKHVEAREGGVAMAFLRGYAAGISKLRGNDAVIEANRIKAMRGDDVK